LKRIVVGLSGGVDSSIAAYLLKQQGYQVVGVYMINWKETIGTLSGSCPYEDDLLVAELVARKLGIEFHAVDLSDVYRQRVVDYLFAEYARGRTPNPDVLCNREIKFDAFLDTARQLGADQLATGHYCRCEPLVGTDGSQGSASSQPIYRLLAGRDANKDQSYFLCQLTQAQLAHAVFPVGELTKPQVRHLAATLGLATAHKKDSQGICFVGKVDLPEFLAQQLAKKTGDVIEIPANFKAYHRSVPPTLEERLRKQARPYTYQATDGQVVGHHQGAHFYTIGQRKGLGIGGFREPLFVLATDVEANLLFVGAGNQHPGLYRKTLKINNDEVHWVRPDRQLETGGRAEYRVRIRYRQPLQQATLYQLEDGLYLDFEQPQAGVTAGQFAVWYEGDELIGSGPISA
jgi:tRNA-specific 2-thiouridylase